MSRVSKKAVEKRKKYYRDSNFCIAILTEIAERRNPNYEDVSVQAAKELLEEYLNQ